jgi:hypothetical protein
MSLIENSDIIQTISAYGSDDTFTKSDSAMASEVP